MTTKIGKSKAGTPLCTFTMDEDEYRDLQDSGLCIRCGEERTGTEPDARKYPCESCGAASVYGIDELLLMGRVNIKEVAA